MTLFDAIEDNNITKVQKLLNSRTVDVNCVDDTYGTPLLLATFNKNTDIVELLLKHNANPDIQDSYYGSETKIGEINCEIIGGWPPLNIACRYGVGCIRIIELLLDYNANPNITNDFNETPLINAVLFSSPDIVKRLLDSNTNVNHQNNDGSTALMKVCQKGTGYLKIAELLLKYNIDVNLQNNDGWTALMLAAQWNHPNIVSLLLEYKANTSLKNDDGDTALKIAKDSKHNRIVQLLQKF